MVVGFGRKNSSRISAVVTPSLSLSSAGFLCCAVIGSILDCFRRMQSCWGFDKLSSDISANARWAFMSNSSCGGKHISPERKKLKKHGCPEYQIPPIIINPFSFAGFLDVYQYCWRFREPYKFSCNRTWDSLAMFPFPGFGSPLTARWLTDTLLWYGGQCPYWLVLLWTDILCPLKRVVGLLLIVHRRISSAFSLPGKSFWFLS